MRLWVTAPGQDGRGAKVYLDGKELTGVTGFDVSVSVDDVNRAAITFIPDSIAIEGSFDDDQVKWRERAQ